MDIRAYYAEIRTQETVLKGQNPSGFVHVVSEGNQDKNSTGGRVAEVSVYTAAKHLVERTARLATKDEVDAFNEAARQFKQRMQPTGTSRKGQVVLVLDDKATQR